MSDAVIDSSVVTKWVLPEPDSAQAERLADDVRRAGGRSIVLDLVYAEVGNAIWKRQRRQLITASQAISALDALLQLSLHVEPTSRLLRSAMNIAGNYDRAVYDAAFVALAADLGLTGVTADEPLHNAVKAHFPQIKLLRDW